MGQILNEPIRTLLLTDVNTGVTIAVVVEAETSFVLESSTFAEFMARTRQVYDVDEVSPVGVYEVALAVVVAK